jgi:hypothetical protein
VEAARALAVRMMQQPRHRAQGRLEFAFQKVLSRSPRSEEAEELTRLYEKHLHDFKNDKESAEKFLAVGDYQVPAGLDAAEIAAWTSVARVILNLHETITRY